MTGAAVVPSNESTAQQDVREGAEFISMYCCSFLSIIATICHKFKHVILAKINLVWETVTRVLIITSLNKKVVVVAAAPFYSNEINLEICSCTCMVKWFIIFNSFIFIFIQLINLEANTSKIQQTDVIFFFFFFLWTDTFHIWPVVFAYCCQWFFD